MIVTVTQAKIFVSAKPVGGEMNEVIFYPFCNFIPIVWSLTPVYHIIYSRPHEAHKIVNIFVFIWINNVTDHIWKIQFCIQLIILTLCGKRKFFCLSYSLSLIFYNWCVLFSIFFNCADLIYRINGLISQGKSLQVD